MPPIHQQARAAFWHGSCSTHLLSLPAALIFAQRTRGPSAFQVPMHLPVLHHIFNDCAGKKAWVRECLTNSGIARIAICPMGHSWQLDSLRLITIISIGRTFSGISSAFLPRGSLRGHTGAHAADAVRAVLHRSSCGAVPKRMEGEKQKRKKEREAKRASSGHASDEKD